MTITSSSNSNDRISELPDATLHQILSLLDMRHVVQTSIISKRWSSLWKFVPYINIRSKENSGGRKLDKVQNFVDKVLQLRDDSVHVEGFILERVHLNCPTFLGHVKTLNLRSVSFPNTSSTWEYVFNLPFVENFILYAPNFRTSGGTRILVSAPCLKHLSIWDYHGGYSENCIDICAPNLTYLLLKGKSYKDYNMGSLASLETAEIDLRFGNEQLFVTCLDKLLKQIYSAKSLSISVRGFQEFPYGLKQVSFSFHNVKYLKLTTWITNGPICPIAELLEGFPNVETLLFKSAKVSYDLGREEDWRSQVSFKSTLSHLKSIEIHDIKGCENELKFLEFLVQNVLVLENITLRSTMTLPGDKEMELIDFCKKLQMLLNASLNVAICLIVKRETGSITLFKESSRLSISSLVIS